MNINPPTLEEMYTAMVEASISQYSEHRGLRTMGALAMVLGHTGGAMDKKAMQPLLRRFVIVGNFQEKKMVVAQIVGGSFQRS